MIQPKFTVSAAAVVVNENDEVLLLNHVLRPFSGWGLPGGFVDHGEQPAETIRRELKEEAGIDLIELKMYSIRTVNRHIEIIYSARGSGEARVMSREIISLGWFGSEAVADKVSKAQSELIRRVLDGRD